MKNQVIFIRIIENGRLYCHFTDDLFIVSDGLFTKKIVYSLSNSANIFITPASSLEGAIYFATFFNPGCALLMA